MLFLIILSLDKATCHDMLSQIRSLAKLTFSPCVDWISPCVGRIDKRITRRTLVLNTLLLVGCELLVGPPGARPRRRIQIFPEFLDSLVVEVVVDFVATVTSPASPKHTRECIPTGLRPTPSILSEFGETIDHLAECSLFIIKVIGLINK